LPKKIKDADKTGTEYVDGAPMVDKFEGLAHDFDAEFT
jgi:hypothetical protein